MGGHTGQPMVGDMERNGRASPLPGDQPLTRDVLHGAGVRCVSVTLAGRVDVQGVEVLCQPACVCDGEGAYCRRAYLGGLVRGYHEAISGPCGTATLRRGNFYAKSSHGVTLSPYGDVAYTVDR